MKNEPSQARWARISTWFILGCTNTLGLRLLKASLPFLLVRSYVYWYQPRRIHQVIQRQHYPPLCLQWVPRQVIWVDTNILSIVPGLVWVVHDYCEFCGRISAGIFVNHKNINIFSICHSSYYRGWSSFPPLRLSRDILNSPNRIRFDLSGWDLSG